MLKNNRVIVWNDYFSAQQRSCSSHTSIGAIGNFPTAPPRQLPNRHARTSAWPASRGNKWIHYASIHRSSLIQTLLSVLELHQINPKARGLYRRWGIAPRPEELFLWAQYTSICSENQADILFYSDEHRASIPIGKSHVPASASFFPSRYFYRAQ